MKHISVIFTSVLAVVTSLATAQTAPLKQWDKGFGGNSSDQLSSSWQTTDGGYILGGTSFSGISGDKSQASQGGNDYWLVKTDANGLKLWDKRFGGTSDDILRWAQQTTDGGYILGGYSSSGIGGDKTEDSRGLIDYWIVKTDANGVKQWDKRFGGPDYDYLNSLQQTSDGGYILGGFAHSGIGGDKSQGSQGGADYWIIKTDANGVKEWDARFGGSVFDDLHYLQQTSDGGYILGGESLSGIGGDKTQASQGGRDYWIVKTNANGVKQWDARFGGSSDDVLYSIEQTSDGAYLLGGYSASGISGDKTQASQGSGDYWIIKINAFGVKEWDARFGGSGDDGINSLQQTSEGGYILGGYSFSGISGDKTQTSQGGADYWLVKTNANGVKQWDARFGGGDYDFISTIQQTVEGGYILGGYTNSGTGGDKTQSSQGASDYWIVKLATECNGGLNVYADVDGDGFGDAGNSLFVSDCVAPVGYVYNNTDCNDHPDQSGAAIHPGAQEIANNGVDDDCNGLIDDVFCPSPINLTVIQITGTSAKLKWNAVPQALAYKVRYKVANTNTWKKGTTYNNSKPISGLLPNTEYEWQAETFCQIVPGINSGWSSLQTFTTAPLRVGGQVQQQATFQLYPNPAEDQATIQYTLLQSSHIYIKVCDVSGKEIATLLNDNMEQGDHSLLLNTHRFSKGVYVVTMISNFGIKNQKLIVQ